MYADKSGNIFYVYNALLPQRTSGSYDFSKTLPGDTPHALWGKYFDFDELPQILTRIWFFTKIVIHTIFSQH